MITHATDSLQANDYDGRRVVVPEGPSYLSNPPGTTWGQAFYSWLFTLDHKRIGVMYLVGISVFFLIAGMMALLVRMELWTPSADFLSVFSNQADPEQAAKDAYNVIFTLHGAIMVFLFIIPSIPAALGNIFLPMMLGAKDVAFPRLNLASFHIYIVGAVFFIGAL
ncbi:MAG: cbb3-type cytochrome c oxidase subunit I, partial [Planctomycetota bacterium]